MDTIGIVELLSPPRGRPTKEDLARWTSVVNDHLKDLRDGAERRRVTIYYFDDSSRTAYVNLGELAGSAVSLVVLGEGRLGVELSLRVEGDSLEKARILPILSRQTRDLAKEILDLAERQYEERQQKLG